MDDDWLELNPFRPDPTLHSLQFPRAKHHKLIDPLCMNFALDRQNYGHEPRLRLQPSEQDRVLRNNRLVELLGRAFAAREEFLEMDEAAARSTKTTKLRHLQRLARLSYLDPAIIRSILKGTQPKSLSARSLWRMGNLPIRFADQREAIGFSNS